MHLANYTSLDCLVHNLNLGFFHTFFCYQNCAICQLQLYQFTNLVFVLLYIFNAKIVQILTNFTSQTRDFFLIFCFGRQNFILLTTVQSKVKPELFSYIFCRQNGILLTVQCVHCVQVCIRLIHKLNRFFSEILCRQFFFFLLLFVL